jgi:two-component system, response regulator
MILNKDIKLKIVIVDDSMDDHFFIKEALEEFKNITFVSFYNGVDFLNYIKEKSKEAHHSSELPDIVILDVNMPKLTGFEVFEKVKEYKVEEIIKFFVLTTSLTDRDLEKCKLLKLECHKKPFSIDAFSILLQAMIKNSGLD